MDLTLFVLVPAILVASSAFHPAYGRDDKLTKEEQRRNEQENEYYRREELIAKELKTLKDHPWAGVYRQSGGIQLHLAPQGGAAFSWSGCVQMTEVNYGLASLENQRLRFQWEIPGKKYSRAGDFSELLLIRWGKRQYLVPPEEILAFCLHVQAEKLHPLDLASLGFSAWLLRSGDEKKPTSGLPELPKEFRQYLTMKPIQATLTSFVSDVRTPSRIGLQEMVTLKVALNAGSNAGVLPRMVFKVVEPKDASSHSARIVEVRPQESIGIIEYERWTGRYENWDGIPIKQPAVGWKLVSP